MRLNPRPRGLGGPRREAAWPIAGLPECAWPECAWPERAFTGAAACGGLALAQAVNAIESSKSAGAVCMLAG